MIKNLREDLKSQGKSWGVTILMVVFGMQMIRLLLLSFVGYLRDSQDVASLDLAPVAIGVFALSFLAALINRVAGTSKALWITAGGLALLRVAEQVANTAVADLYLSILGVVLFLLYIPVAVGNARSQGGQASSQLGVAFLMGLSVDSAIFIGLKTLDLSWQPGIFSLVAVLALSMALIYWLKDVAKNASSAHDGNWTANMGLLAFGPWMFLQFLIFQNVGLTGSLTGGELPTAGLLLLLGNAIGIYLASQLQRYVSSPFYTFLLGASLLLLLLQVSEPAGFLSVIWLLIGQTISFTFGLNIFQQSGTKQGKAGLMRSTILFGLGQIIFVLFVFVYYASYDLAIGIGAQSLLPAAGFLVLVGIMLSQRGSSLTASGSASNSPVLLASSLLIIPLLLALGWKTPMSIEMPINKDGLRVMDYNLHNGVNTYGRLDPEALALVIEDSGADVIAFQEISRGWLTWGGMDMLAWLSQRLDMNYVWGPTADAQWGNALFSRYPITNADLLELPPDDVLLLRGHIWAQIDVGGVSLNVIATHFSHRDDQSPERVLQASALLSTWNNAPLTIVMGDLNATPDSEEMRLLRDNGLIDISAEIGTQPTYTYYSANPDHQIDYIYVSSDLGFSDFSIPQTTASDHLPLVSTIFMVE
jgi:endonuclease/exonuclease/phosphatase family metal-dependent hydrolase